MHDTTFSEGKNAVLYKSGLTLHGKIPCGIYVTLHATVNFTYLFMVYMFNNLKQLMELNFFWRIIKKNYTKRKQDSDNLSEVFSSCNFWPVDISLITKHSKSYSNMIWFLPFINKVSGITLHSWLNCAADFKFRILCYVSVLNFAFCVIDMLWHIFSIPVFCCFKLLVFSITPLWNFAIIDFTTCLAFRDF